MATIRRSRENPQIRDFIIANVEAHPRNIASLTGEAFGLTRQSIAGYLRRLKAEGLIESTGATSARRYQLRELSHETFMIDIGANLDESAIWQFRLLPRLLEVKKNVLDICQYGFTEMLNNAIDHSASRKCVISYSQNAARIDIFVIDFGIGIFEKIQRDFDLPDPRSALLELSKGRLTSAPERHAGEGIFYTSRMFDTFSIGSGHLFYERTRRDDDDWLIEISQRENFTAGTSVKMRISTATDLTQQTVFDQYHADGMRFRKTHVPVSLARYDNEQLVSRSQAKRVLARFENFSEVMLDFNGVDQIGQPFADEIFRVFALSHPGTPIVAVRANDSIKRVIEGVRAAALAQRPGEAQDEET